MAGRHVHSHRPIKTGKHAWAEKPVSIVPLRVQEALREAMKEEGIPDADFTDLLWIMAQESEGVVDARNANSKARGLYQLLQAQYSLNPRGIASFGNAKEECQGGIRYIYGRYSSARIAKIFWKTHHWY